ncbi:MAG: ADP-ribose diphosphatase [Gammaproteobacteria bacterium]|nr:MAG: ADP-ribose diphosphatase [Gammaproteobacteria bacterium]
MVTFVHKDYQVIDSKTVFQGYFAIEQVVLKHRLFNGGWSNTYQREIFERGDAAAVVLYDPCLEKVVLLEQFRPGAVSSTRSPWMIEVVAGIIEQGETAEGVARREAFEEAGQRIDDLITIGSYFTTPGGSSEKITLYCALVDAKDAGGIFGLEHENEDIRVFTLSLDEVSKGLEQGLFENATALIAMQWLVLNHQKMAKTYNLPKK